ncbi:MAG: adenosylcobyric acid synthase, partial [Candidatus Azotimanducaceae bacterium]
MFQGTGSDVGKSTLVAGLCRWAKQQGISVAPFKPQNMSNNAAACNNGGEIGRAQALQARAAGLSPTVHMNPVLLKPQADGVSQVIVQGQSIGESSARKYFTGERKNLIQPVLESFEKLINEYDLILVEGAGSPAETNLRQHDIANMGFATRVSSPVSLIADIDRGGVIAALVGTQQVLDSLDKSLIKSFIINKFRGDPSLFTEGVESIESITGWTCHGIVPWLPAA